MIAQNIDNKQMRDARQESFCQWMARGNVSITQAYKNAGYSERTASSAGCKLSKIASIKTRIEQIKAVKERKVVVTPQIVAIEADDNYHLALSMGDIKAANAALVIKAKAYGCQTDKTVNEQTDAQTARSALDREHGAEWAKICLDRALARPEALQAVNVVDITELNSVVSCTSGCSDDAISGITGQEQGQ